MSLAAQPRSQTQGIANGTAESSIASGPEETLSSGSWLVGLAMLTLGGLTTGAAVASLLLALGAPAVDAPVLSTVPLTEIDSAVLSLPSGSAAAAAADAKSCKAPLAYVTVSSATSGTAGSIRIRSGSYLSPAIAVGAAPSRVAIPFPAAYEAGRGVLRIEGTARDLSVWLTPRWQTVQLDGAVPINVTWVPRKNC